MKKISSKVKGLFISIIFLYALTSFCIPADAAYKISLKSRDIEITSPEKSGLDINEVLSIEGVTKLEQVWFCVRGPGGEVSTYPAEAIEGRFQLDIFLRFGPGTYTIWAGNNQTKFDGTIRFQVTNKLNQDTRYLAPSAYVDSDNAEIRELVGTLTGPEMSEMEKLEAIHHWVTTNLEYDYLAYKTGQNQLIAASETIMNKKGTCRDYAFVVAALSRAAGLQARVVYGQALGYDSWQPQAHAWNEVCVDGNWVAVDATWDAGFIKDNSFVAAPSTKFLAPDVKVLAITHVAPTKTLH